MEFYKAVERRRSIRRFKPDGIPPRVIGDTLQVVALTADKCHADRCRVLMVSNKETIERRVAEWTDADEASWAQQGIPFPKQEQIGDYPKGPFALFL